MRGKDQKNKQIKKKTVCEIQITEKLIRMFWNFEAPIINLQYL